MPYRRFAIGWADNEVNARPWWTRRRMQFCDTADYKSVLRLGVREVIRGCFTPADTVKESKLLIRLLAKTGAPQRTQRRKVIVVETPPETPDWSGIADRLRRAAA